MTKVNIIKDSISTKFEKLKSGDYFLCDNMLYCKTKADCANSFNLETGKTEILPSNKDVIFVKNICIKIDV